jgi:hypothetical protein
MSVAPPDCALVFRYKGGPKGASEWGMGHGGAGTVSGGRELREENMFRAGQEQHDDQSDEARSDWE